MGGFYLAFAVLFRWAAFGLIHLGWHVTHLESLGTMDAIAQTTGLAAVLAPCFLAAAAFRPDPLSPR